MSQAERGSPRDRAQAVLAADRWDSATTAAIAAGATFGSCTAVIVALLPKDQVTWQALVVSAAAIVGTFAFAFIFAELRRLGRCRAALDDVLRDERVYDVLLADARGERDAALKEKLAVYTQVEVLRAVTMAAPEQPVPIQDHPEPKLPAKAVRK